MPMGDPERSSHRGKARYIPDRRPGIHGAITGAYTSCLGQVLRADRRAETKHVFFHLPLCTCFCYFSPGTRLGVPDTCATSISIAYIDPPHGPLRVRGRTQDNDQCFWISARLMDSGEPSESLLSSLNVYFDQTRYVCRPLIYVTVAQPAFLRIRFAC